MYISILIIDIISSSKSFQFSFIHINTYNIPVDRIISRNPNITLRQVSCFLSNGSERPPHAPAQRQQQKHKLKKKIIMFYLQN